MTNHDHSNYEQRFDDIVRIINEATRTDSPAELRQVDMAIARYPVDWGRHQLLARWKKRLKELYPDVIPQAQEADEASSDTTPRSYSMHIGRRGSKDSVNRLQPFLAAEAARGAVLYAAVAKLHQDVEDFGIGGHVADGEGLWLPHEVEVALTEVLNAYEVTLPGDDDEAG